MPKPTSQSFVLSLFTAWCISLFVGFFWLSADAAKASPAARAPQKIAVQDLWIANNKPQLFVFLHPRCACSFATLNELERVIASVSDKPDIHFYFADVMDHQALLETHLWQQAQHFNAQSLQIDIQNIADFFAVESSGTLLLYKANGELLFNGGITASRGHEGDNAGKSQLISILNQQTFEPTQPAVFGCALAQHHDSLNPIL